MRINGENADKYMAAYNFIVIADWLISNTDKPYIVVRKKQDKGEKIRLDLDFTALKFSDYIGFLENLANEKEKLEEELRDKGEAIKKLEESLFSIVNSKSWKLFGVLRSMKARILKIFNK